MVGEEAAVAAAEAVAGCPEDEADAADEADQRVAEGGVGGVETSLNPRLLMMVRFISPGCKQLTRIADSDGPPRPPPASRSRPKASRPNQAASVMVSTVECKCKVPVAERTVVKESANKGRKFRTCGNKGECDFFEWTDDPPGPNPGGIAAKAIPAKRTLTERSVIDMCYEPNQMLMLLISEKTVHEAQMEVLQNYATVK